ncbi:MAG: DUF4864 domain-containing protein [Rhizobiaceae bacterium]
MRALIPVLLAAIAGVSLALADEVSQKQAQDIIRGQIEAFKSGQDAAAYSFASPTVKGFFPDVSIFMDMVKRGYQPVYNPKNYDFGRTKEPADGTVIQEVLVTGPDGKPWTAIYTLVRQSDGLWKINGVQLLPGDDSSA